MLVTNITTHHHNNLTTFSADFIFNKPYGDQKHRFHSYLFILKKYIKQPWKILRERRQVSQRIWFTLPSQYVLHPYADDAFFFISLGLAFFLQENLQFDGIVSSELTDRLPEFKKYFDYGIGDRKISFSSQIGKREEVKRTQTGQFFTLGVDSFFTLISRRPPQQKSRYLIYIDGYDIPLGRKSFLQNIHQRITSVAKESGDTPLFVQTNLREVSDKIIGWGQYHVSALAAVGTLLKFKKIYIPGETFNWPDWGLRSEAASLFSFNDLTFELVGHNQPRDVSIKKIKRSTLSSLFINQVRTCWRNVEDHHPAYNCSVCPKCVRTQLTLLAAGYKHMPTFLPLNIENIEKLTLNVHIHKEWRRLYTLFQQQPTTDPRLLRAIKKVIDKPLDVIPRAYRKQTI